MRFRRIPTWQYDEAVIDAIRYKQQSERLLAALKRTERELGEELYRLQRDLSWAMDANACLALEISEKDHELSQLRGDA